LTQEGLHSIHTCNHKATFFKVDLPKDFDRFNWLYINSFSSTWASTINSSPGRWTTTIQPLSKYWLMDQPTLFSMWNEIWSMDALSPCFFSFS
jgi:hypothetical protein